MTDACHSRVAGACHRAAVAEVGHRRPDGTIGMNVVVPLAWSGFPALALSYAHRRLAHDLASSGDAVLVLSDPRLARKRWEPLAASVRFELIEDQEGTRFLDEGLLGQELLKYPPSRTLADTPLLRREHWWYVPRVLLWATVVDRVNPVGRRGPRDGVLAHTATGPLHADTVTVEDWDADPLRLRSLGSEVTMSDHDVPGTLLGHDFSVPDREREARRVVTGTLQGGSLQSKEAAGSLELGKPASLLTRLRMLRDLERACRAGLPQQR